MAEAYFTFKNYKVRNVFQFSEDRKHTIRPDGTSVPNLNLEKILNKDFFKEVNKCIANVKPEDIPRDKFIEEQYRKPAPGLDFGRCD